MYHRLIPPSWGHSSEKGGRGKTLCKHNIFESNISLLNVKNSYIITDNRSQPLVPNRPAHSAHRHLLTVDLTRYKVDKLEDVGGDIFNRDTELPAGTQQIPRTED